RRWPRAQRAMTGMHARLYALTGGRFIPRWFAGAPVMVMETVGRKTGKRRRTPVLYLRDGESLVVLAANAGAQRAPSWWLNLRDDGEAAVVVGRRRLKVRPRILGGPERERLWDAFVAMYPQAADYTGFTDRELPLVALDPADSDDPGGHEKRQSG
ncbi:MAG TPA: nitroreductase/quinone reductase family protein, partial [Solirubrobacterales bacterium]|nr:nitroreductase/quinone reductase family protein [Solirubrobacterales bacterium]